MQSENLLRTDYSGGYDSDDDSGESGGSIERRASINSLSPMAPNAQEAASAAFIQASTHISNYMVSPKAVFSNNYTCFDYI